MAFTSVALLVDGDNVRVAYAGQIRRKAGDLGPNRIRRVYCNGEATGWSEASSFRLIHAGKAKNAADILLAIEAMEFALSDRIEAFVLVTSDRDMSHLATRLRERGHHVLGMGEEKAPVPFRRACSTFVQLASPTAKGRDDKLSKLDRDIREAIRGMEEGSNSALVTRLNEVMRSRFGVKISQTDEGNWARYLAKRPHLYTLKGEAKERVVQIASEESDL